MTKPNKHTKYWVSPSKYINAMLQTHKVMPNEFLNNRKRTFCLRSKKCCTVSYYKKKCQKELEIQTIERERGV